MPMLLFILWPLVEIALFVTVGGAIGLGATLAIVLGTAVAGSMLIRRGGGRAMADVQRALVELRDPTLPMARGAVMMMAGTLLIAPGFLTDLLGLVLLVPPLRALILRAARRSVRARVRFPQPSPHRYRHGAVIDGDYVDTPSPAAPDLPPPAGGSNRPSGWTQDPQAH